MVAYRTNVGGQGSEAESKRDRWEREYTAYNHNSRFGVRIPNRLRTRPRAQDPKPVWKVEKWRESGKLEPKETAPRCNETSGPGGCICWCP